MFRPPYPGIMINNVKVTMVIHLGHQLNEDIYKLDTSKCVSDHNRECNKFLSLETC